jgi:Tfp pilus assembly protein PilN
MNDIDFLPADYVCVQVTRQNNNWLRGLFVAVLALMAIGWGTQQKSIRNLQARRDRMADQAAAMLARVNSTDDLKLELQQNGNVTRLLDGLRTQVPPTRWLTAIVGALPEEASVSEIHTDLEDGDVPVQPDPANANRQNSVPADPMQQDLERLAKLTPRRALMISVRGSANDDLEVSEFLTALHRTGLFERVQLLFTDQQTVGDKTIRSFAIRMRTRPVSAKVKRSEAQPVATSDRGFQ